MNTVGQILSIERNSKNLSISDISIELKISKSIIIDLENDNINSAVELMATLMLEVPILCKAINVNPFDQPAVEKVKLRTKKLLNKYV